MLNSTFSTNHIIYGVRSSLRSLTIQYCVTRRKWVKSFSTRAFKDSSLCFTKCQYLKYIEVAFSYCHLKMRVRFIIREKSFHEAQSMTEIIIN